MKGKIRFTKMHGAGNDYVYVYTPLCAIDDPATLAVAVSRPHVGIGSDGLILIDSSTVADFGMRIFNSDGSEGMMCGNGLRCVGKYVYDHRLTDKTSLDIETRSGIKHLELHIGADNMVESATACMGEPLMSNPRQVSAKGGKLSEQDVVDGMHGTFVCMGNPHFVVFTENADHIDPSVDGPRLEKNPVFPERCNIEFASLKADGTLRMRVWERGSGITMACGTGACATAVAAAVTGRTGRDVKVQMDGGTLRIEWREDNKIYMTGPAVTVFEGEYHGNC